VAAALSLASFAALADGERYVLMMKNDAIPANLARTVQQAGGTLVRTLPQVGIAIAVSSDPRFAATLARDSRLASVGPAAANALPTTADAPDAPTAPTAVDTLYTAGLLWGIDRVKAPQAWAMGYTGSHDTVVAVIDTGIASNHPDLAPNLVHEACFVSTGDHTTGACTPYPSFSDHGTHVAGTVAAAFGGGRIVGVAPNAGLAGYNTFEPIEGCGICTYGDSRWAAMIDAADRGFDVINMSLGSLVARGGRGTNELSTYMAADKKVADYVLKAGLTIAASAGNSDTNLNGPYANIPGGYPGVLNTAATGIRPQPRYPQPGAYDVLAFYSNYGAAVDVAAPGGDCGLPDNCDPAKRPANWFEYLVLSSTVTPTAACAATRSCAVGYGWKAGTSMASPHVAGIAALVHDAHPELDGRQVANVVKRTAESLGDRQRFGHGMVDAAAAVTAK
jgi:subtilisin family serine protease